MRKIRCYVCWPFAGAADEECEIEVEDNATEEEINELATETCNELIYNRVNCGWEEV